MYRFNIKDKYMTNNSDHINFKIYTDININHPYGVFSM